MLRGSPRPGYGLGGILAIALTLSSATPVRAQAPASDLPPEAVRLIEAVLAEKAQRTPAQQKVDSRLLHERRARRGTTIAAEASVRRTIAVSSDGLVTVDILADITPQLLTRIADAGGIVVNEVPGYRSVRARVPVDSIDTIAELSEVQFIGPAAEMTTFQRRPQRVDPYDPQDVEIQKDNTSQGDVAHRAALARALYGVTGAGIGVGVLSNGVDNLADRQASGDLPAVTILSNQGGSGREGSAMLEVVHDLAPGASLFFATASGSQAQFAANIEALCAAGARIIVDDVAYVEESVFQDGIVAQAVNNVTANGCIHFSAAGNFGNKNDGTSGVWEGDFVAAAANPVPGGGQAHSFSGANSNQITQDSTGLFTLQWADPRGGSTNDYELFLFNAALNTLLLSSTNTQNGTQDPYESIDSRLFTDATNRLVIVRFSGAARYLHLNLNGGRLSNSTAGQIAGHASARNTISVGAVNVATAGGGAFTGGAANPIQTSSADGPRRIFYQANGTPITPGNFSSTGGELVPKPDVAAADCVATATPGFTTFCDTSAAVAHAAAIGALMLQASPSLLKSTLHAAITARAIDIEAPGPDRDSGTGIADAIGAVGRTHPAFIDSPVVSGSTVVKGVHITQLRNRVNAQRVRCGLPQTSFTDPVLPAGLVAMRGVHVAELRTALNAAYSACSLTPPAYSTDPTITTGSTTVKAAHISELRAAIIALE